MTTDNEGTVYYAIQAQDWSNCEALRWAGASIRHYVKATGLDPETVYRAAVQRVGHDSVKVFSFDADGKPIQWED
jgi:hypothetical protein